jgi:hypothetical protein
MNGSTRNKRNGGVHLTRGLEAYERKLLQNNLLDNCIAGNTTIVEFDNYFQHNSVKAKVPKSPPVTVAGYCKQPDRP